MTTTPLHKQVLSRYSSVPAWLELWGNLGRAPATLDAYGRALAHDLLHYEGSGLQPESATFEQA
ncbi:site-specific integrase, partial [Pseudomonas aeruginosa]